MFRFMFLRAAALVASIIFIVGPSFGAGITTKPVGGRDLTGFRLDRPRALFENGCTDSFNVPATTVGVDVRTLTNWDTMAEAINPDKNINDAVQTSGSADGWCDSYPWVIKGSVTGAGLVYIGPLKTFPYQGFLVEANYAAAAGNYQYAICHKATYDVSVCRNDGLTTAVSTTASNLVWDFVPTFSNSASQYSVADNFWFPEGRDAYLTINFASAGAYTFGLGLLPVVPYYEHRGD